MTRCKKCNREVRREEKHLCLVTGKICDPITDSGLFITDVIETSVDSVVDHSDTIGDALGSFFDSISD